MLLLELKPELPELLLGLNVEAGREFCMELVRVVVERDGSIFIFSLDICIVLFTDSRVLLCLTILSFLEPRSTFFIVVLFLFPEVVPLSRLFHLLF